MKTEITFEQFKTDGDCAALDRNQAEAVAYLARLWFGADYQQAFLAYWESENED